MYRGNRLLDRLPADVIARLQPHFELVELLHGQVVHRPGEEIRYLYFPLTCVISVTLEMIDGTTVETSALGSREVVGINALMGGRETTHTRYIVQVPGDALRVAAGPLKAEFDRNTELHFILLKYMQAMIAHISQNVGCNSNHPISNRCARWLLETCDRVRSDSFELTHEFLGQTLGASRVSVSRAMAEFKEAGIIAYSRGRINILDRSALKSFSRECYSVLRAENERLLGPFPSYTTNGNSSVPIALAGIAAKQNGRKERITV
jgi:CRP-like cAMP-binding protein